MPIPCEARAAFIVMGLPARIHTQRDQLLTQERSAVEAARILVFSARRPSKKGLGTLHGGKLWPSGPALLRKTSRCRLWRHSPRLLLLAAAGAKKIITVLRQRLTHKTNERETALTSSRTRCICRRHVPLCYCRTKRNEAVVQDS